MAPERSLPARALLLAALLVGATVLGFFVWRAIDAARDVTGESLVIERAPDVQGILELNVTRPQQEAPALARLLDLAWISGKATTRDTDTVAEALRYLDIIAQENGAENWKGTPIEGTFAWDGKTLRVLHFER